MNYTVNKGVLSGILSDKSQITQFEKHMIQEGIKQILFNDGKKLILDESKTIIGYDLTDAMKMFLIDYGIIGVGNQLSELLDMLNIKIVNSPTFYINDKFEVIDKADAKITIDDNSGIINTENNKFIQTGSMNFSNKQIFNNFLIENKNNKIYIFNKDGNIFDETTSGFTIRCAVLN